jgi:hypothetical protein
MIPARPCGGHQWRANANLGMVLCLGKAGYGWIWLSHVDISLYFIKIPNQIRQL